MKHFSRAELVDIVTTFLISNTPKSLFRAMKNLSVVERLRDEMSPEYLLNAFNLTTGKANKTSLAAALSYVYLIALLTSPKRGITIENLDASRLIWGEEIQQLAETNKVTDSTATFSIASAMKALHPIGPVDYKANSNSVIILP